MNILIACHAGAGMGLGHLSRMLVAAKAFREQLCATVAFIVQGDAVAREGLAGSPHRFVVPGENFTNAIDAASTDAGSDVVVLDLHPKHVPSDLGDLICRLGAAGRKVVAIDGLLEHRPSLDLIFIPSFRFVPPVGLLDGAPIVFGWDCYLLDVRESPVEWFPGPRILALTGGSDATGLGKTWPRVLDETLPRRAEVDWVTGPFADVPIWPAVLRTTMRHHEAPDGLGRLMQTVNYAVTIFGVSFFELLYFGIPTVVFSPYGAKDDPELATIAESGIAVVARDEVEATQSVRDLMLDDNRARELSKRARETMGTRGEQRLCAEIARLM